MSEYCSNCGGAFGCPCFVYDFEPEYETAGEISAKGAPMTPPLPPHIQAIKDRVINSANSRPLKYTEGDVILLLNEIFSQQKEVERLREALGKADEVIEYLINRGDIDIDELQYELPCYWDYNDMKEALNPTGGEELGEGGGS
jgi:hypothetical protein